MRAAMQRRVLAGMIAAAAAVATGAIAGSPGGARAGGLAGSPGGAWAGGLAGSPGGARAGGLAAHPAQAAAPCMGDYAHGPYRPAARLRFGIDPGLAGSAGAVQHPARPVSATRTIAALRALRPPGRDLVLRVNRLFQSDGEAGIRRFERIVRGYADAGFATELQVRYHPSPRQAGDIAAWTRYVRHVVDAFGSDPHVIAMTITNEVNVSISPNTSDGYYPRAEQALVDGIIAAHREARRRGFDQLRFGFTYAYRFIPAQDAALFSGLRRGGAALRRALGFVGVDYYPELVPGPGTPIPTATRQMLGTVRRCLMALGGLSPKVPIWITETGYDTQRSTPAAQRATLRQIVTTVHGAARSFGVTDLRWFNLRDNLSSSATFAETSGLLTDRYRRKPAFSAYRGLIARYGTVAARRISSPAADAHQPDTPAGHPRR